MGASCWVRPLTSLPRLRLALICRWRCVHAAVRGRRAGRSTVAWSSHRARRQGDAGHGGVDCYPLRRPSSSSCCASAGSPVASLSAHIAFATLRRPVRGRARARPRWNGRHPGDPGQQLAEASHPGRLHRRGRSLDDAARVRRRPGMADHDRVRRIQCRSSSLRDQAAIRHLGVGVGYPDLPLIGRVPPGDGVSHAERSTGHPAVGCRGATSFALPRATPLPRRPARDNAR